MNIFTCIKNKIKNMYKHEEVSLEEAEKYCETFVGFNCKLRQKRLDLDFSETEAAIKLDISKTELRLIENGYIGIRKEVKAKIISKYSVDESFFVNENSYPTPIKKTIIDTFTGSKLHRFLASWKVIIFSLLMVVGFASMALSSIGMSQRLSQNTTSFYTDKINALRKGIIENHDEENPETGSVLCGFLGDTYYDVKNDKSSIDDIAASLNVFKNDENSSYTFLDAKFSTKLLSILNINCEFEMRMIGKNKARIHLYVYDGSSKIATVSSDYDWKEFKTSYIFGYDSKGEEVYYSESSVIYQSYLGILKASFTSIENEFTSFFASTKLSKYNLSYNDFKLEQSSSVANEMSFYNTKNVFLAVGLIFSTIFLMIGVLGILLKFSLPSKIDNKITSSEAEDEQLSLSSQRVRKLPKNLKIFPVLPETLVKLVAIIIMLAASITMYTVFNDALRFNVIGVIDTLNASNILFNLTCVAIILMFFTKLDIHQNQKDSFTTNFILFFGGLLFYFLLLITKTELSYSQTTFSKISSALFNFLPGNIIWGILAFNLLCAFLFNSYDFKKNSKTKTIIYRCFAIVPIAYLILSVLINIGSKPESGWGWNVPFEVKSLFFTKSIIIVLFAIFYCLAVFFYRRRIIKHYGLGQAKIYMNGNAYCFTKNIIACLIILVLGIVDIVCKNTCPNNVFGFGSNNYILLAIPVLLLYRSHLGDRNKTLDLLTMALYAISMTIGILLVIGYASSYFGGL